MNLLKFLTVLFVSLFLANFASAAIVTSGTWTDGSNTITITNGESADFRARFYEYVYGSTTPSITISIILYDTEHNEIYTILSAAENSASYDRILTVTQSIYGTIGSYEIILVGTDSTGAQNSDSLFLTVNPTTTPTDDQAPVITLLGNNPQVIELGNPYIELGATASDNIDGDLTNQIAIDTTLVNTNSVGLYIVTYSVSDSSGNSATAFRTINVTNQNIIPQDTTAPVITLIGNNPQIIQLGNPYIELGATATDDVDGDLSSSIIINASLVNTSIVGLYNVTYNVADSSGNQATEVNRTINVTSAQVDTTVPIITIISPKDKTYKTNKISFEVKVNEDAVVWYSLNGGYNITMTETSNLVFEHERKLSNDDYEVIFYAIDSAGNIGTKDVSFEVNKNKGSKKKEEPEEPIDYFSSSVKEPLEITLTPANSTKELKLGYIILFLLAIGILIILLLIILITRAKDEQKKIRQESYKEIFED